MNLSIHRINQGLQRHLLLELKRENHPSIFIFTSKLVNLSLQVQEERGERGWKSERNWEGEKGMCGSVCGWVWTSPITHFIII